MEFGTMRIETLEIQQIIADEGMILTNGEAYSSVGGRVSIGKNDSIDNWHEITEEEYQEILKEQEENNEY
jgi:hypothetical protein